MRRRRDTDYHRYGPGNDADAEGWPAYPAGAPGPSDPLSATRDADLTGPAATTPGTRPADAAPHRSPGAPPSGTVEALLRDADPAAQARRTAFEPTAGDDEPPAGIWRTARSSVVAGLVVGAVYLGTCTGRGLAADDGAILVPVGFAFLLLLGASLVTGAAWIVRRALAQHRGRTAPLSRALRRWTKLFGALLGFVVAACVWSATLA